MMEQSRSPCKISKDQPETPQKTPSAKNTLRHSTLHSGGFNFHKTPPSGLTQFIARNPFDAELTNRLHLSVISPTIFHKVSPKSKSSGGSSPFAWTIDELAIMTPATIDEFPHQQYNVSDPEVEHKAQKAIDQFFSKPEILPSPWHIKREPQLPLVMMTPTRPVEALSISRESHMGTRDCGTQTVLTLPPELPKELEEALKPYFTYTQDQNVETDDANSSNNSLRRKLFFNHEETSDEEEEPAFTLSPLKGSSSPPQSGMFVHGTPMRCNSSAMQRYHGTPYTGSRNMSPPNMSPISNDAHDMSCQSISSRPRSAARLDFTTFMSIDVSSSEDKKENNEEKDSQNTPTPTNNEPRPVQSKDETIEMISIIQDKTENDKIVEFSENSEIVENNGIKINGEYKSTSISNNSQGHCTTLVRSNYSEQNSAFNQDTGYQTYSMNNTSDNRSITPLRKKFNWNDKISINKTAGHEDDVKSSNWQENIKNMFSSTPSKHNRPKDIL